MRKIAKEAELEIIVKTILSILLGMGLSHLLGWTMSLTMTFACILISYTNRGIKGSGTYFRKRMQTQLLMCILLSVLVLLLEYFFPGMEAWIVFFISCILLTPLFLYLHYAYQFSPLNLTAVISPMIILNTALSDSSYFYWRLILTFCGLLIGWGMAAAYPFRNKVGRAIHSIRSLTDITTTEILNMVSSERFGLSDQYMSRLRKELPEELSELSAYLNVVYQDANRSKYKPVAKDLPRIKAEQNAAVQAVEFAKYLDCCKSELNCLDPAFKSLFRSAVSRLCMLHRTCYDGRHAVPLRFEESLAHPSEFHSDREVLIWFHFLKYKDAVGQLITASLSDAHSSAGEETTTCQNL